MLELIYPIGPAPLVRGCRMSRSSEMLPIIDELGYVQFQAPRQYCHSGSFALHPVVHLHVINRNSEIYLQKRSATKELLPSRWDTAVGGHVSYGEYIREALFREAGEEIGLYDFNPCAITDYVFTSGTEKEMVCVFAAVGDFKLTPDADEVEEGRFWSIEDIEATLGKGVFTPNFELEYSKVKQPLLALL